MNELLNKRFLESIGIVLDDETYQALAEHYANTLDERVINEIIEELDETQLVELTNLKSEKPEALQQWLVVNVPQLNEIIEDEIAILLGDITESSDQITAH